MAILWHIQCSRICSLGTRGPRFWTILLDRQLPEKGGPMVASIIIISIITLIVVVIYAVHEDRWAAVKLLLREPIGEGEFAYTHDMPNAFRNGREYVVTIVKNLHTDPEDGCRYMVDLVHDENDWLTIKLRQEDIDASGMTPLQYIKKEVYRL